MKQMTLEIYECHEVNCVSDDKTLYLTMIIS